MTKSKGGSTKPVTKNECQSLMRLHFQRAESISIVSKNMGAVAYSKVGVSLQGNRTLAEDIKTEVNSELNFRCTYIQVMSLLNPNYEPGPKYSSQTRPKSMVQAEPNEEHPHREKGIPGKSGTLSMGGARPTAFPAAVLLHRKNSSPRGMGTYRSHDAGYHSEVSGDGAQRG